MKLSPAVKEKLKKAMNDCYKAIVNITDETGRKRCEMFKELPDKSVSLCLSYPLRYPTP